MRPLNTHSKTLSELARFLSVESMSTISFTGLSNTSGYIEQGDLFIAMPGAKTHGAHYLPEAMKNGAVAVLTDFAGSQIVGSLLPVVIYDEVRSASADVAAWFYNRPFAAMSSFGITGTNGKTTSASLLHQLWEAQGRSVGMIGTTGVVIDRDEYPASFTTPEGAELQAIAATMRERCITHVVMEVSSHALAEKRIRGSHFDCVAFTNLTQDHLDYHGTMDEYFAAKSLLFTQEYADHAIINIDDPWGLKLVESVHIPAETISRRNTSADWHYSSTEKLPSGGYQVSIRGLGGILIEGRTHLIGEHNLDNLLLAIAMGYASGLDPIAMGVDLSRLIGAIGRLERIDVGQEYVALVDFAHTPDAVKRVLQAVRGVSEGRIIAVLGCGGDRDPSKRPLMGDALVAGSDIAIFTSDNPRSEDPLQILAEMVNGREESQRVIIEANRRQAIARAVAEALPGDTVIVLGKGHEKGQEIKGVKEPFDDRIELAKAIEALS
jgi:UDP-N-acetylmuramoyl-L-alanyl-D-glutamate--2,6-diaminopimelate ligase